MVEKIQAKHSKAMSKSDSVTAAQEAKTTQQFQQGDNMQTFVALQEEKRRLLNTADQQFSKSKQTAQTQQQMNDLSRRVHAVVQRMSANDRYKRKKKTTVRNHTAVATERAQPTDNRAESSSNEQQSQLLPSQQCITSECNRLSRMQAEVDECRQRLVNFDGWTRLAGEMQKDVNLYKEMADLLRGKQPADKNSEEEEEQQQQEQSDQPEPSERDRRRNSLRELIKGVVKSAEESRIEAERSRLEAEEEARLFQARLEEQRAQADERARLRQARFEEQQAEQDRIHRAQRAHADEQLRTTLAQNDEQLRLTLAQIDERYARAVEQTEMERARRAQIKEQRALESKRRRESLARSEEQHLRLFRRIDKRKENDAWHEEWTNRHLLVAQRRCHQSANAG